VPKEWLKPFPFTSDTPSNLKIDLEVPKAYRKLEKKNLKWRRERVGGNSKIEFGFFFVGSGWIFDDFL